MVFLTGFFTFLHWILYFIMIICLISEFPALAVKYYKKGGELGVETDKDLNFENP